MAAQTSPHRCGFHATPPTTSTPSARARPWGLIADVPGLLPHSFGNRRRTGHHFPHDAVPLAGRCRLIPSSPSPSRTIKPMPGILSLFFPRFPELPAPSPALSTPLPFVAARWQPSAAHQHRSTVPACRRLYSQLRHLKGKLARHFSLPRHHRNHLFHHTPEPPLPSAAFGRRLAPLPATSRRATASIAFASPHRTPAATPSHRKPAGAPSPSRAGKLHYLLRLRPIFPATPCLLALA